MSAAPTSVGTPRATDPPHGQTRSDGGKLKVFISYSRSDTAFADEIVGGLEFDGGFDVRIDRHDIHEGEEWKRRLGALIASADTIVFVLSLKSAASPICRWEVDHAKALSKRIIPVQAAPLGDQPAPDALSALNYVRFDEGRSFIAGLTGLRRALKTDIDWLREHTRLLERAQEWLAADKSENRLLSGRDIVAAKAWLERTPAAALQPLEIHRDFIQASDQAESLRLSAERERAERLQKAVTRTRVALAGATVLALAAVAAGLWAFAEQRQSNVARQALAEKVEILKKKEAELLDYYNQAGKAIRDFAQLRYQTIMARHKDDAASKPGAGISAAVVEQFTNQQLIDHVGPKAFDMIIDLEVGGRAEYERKYTRPEWPGENSGVTIGIGFDLGYYTVEEVQAAWSQLPAATLERLKGVTGVTKEKAHAALPSVSDIVISYETALAVFRDSTIAKYARQAARRFPKSIDLPPDCFGSLVSVGFNRGFSMNGDRRREILAIKNLVEAGELQAVPEQFQAMKWLWDRDLKGLHRRRAAEAALFASCAQDLSRKSAVPQTAAGPDVQVPPATGELRPAVATPP